MPSFINELSLQDLKGMVAKHPSLLLVDPSRLNSADSLALRKNLHGVGARMRLAKVSLVRRAVPESAVKLIEGKNAIALVSCQDMLGAAKIVCDLAKEEKISLKGGLMDGQTLNPAQVTKIASLPSKQTLRGMLVNLLAAPLTSL